MVRGMGYYWRMFRANSYRRTDIPRPELTERKEARLTYDLPWTQNAILKEGQGEGREGRTKAREEQEKERLEQEMNKAESEARKEAFRISLLMHDPEVARASFGVPVYSQHLLLNFCLRELQSSCEKWGKRWLGQANLYCGGTDHWGSRMTDVQRRIRARPEVSCSPELSNWNDLFIQCSFPAGVPLVRWGTEGFSFNNLRQAAIHRSPIHGDRLRKAPDYARQLGDIKGAEKLEQVLSVVFGANEEERDKAYLSLRLPETRFATIHQALHRIQDLLEESGFRYGRDKYANHFASKGWEHFCQVELRDLQEVYSGMQQTEYTNDYGSFLFEDLLYQARELRNTIAHRNLISVPSLAGWTIAGIKLAVLFGDRAQAVRIELAGGEWLTGQSRRQLLNLSHEETSLDNRASPHDLERARKKRFAIATVFMSSFLRVRNGRMFFEHDDELPGNTGSATPGSSGLPRGCPDPETWSGSLEKPKSNREVPYFMHCDKLMPQWLRDRRVNYTIPRLWDCRSRAGQGLLPLLPVHRQMEWVPRARFICLTPASSLMI